MAESEDFVRTVIETLKDVRALWWAVATIGAAVVAWLFLPFAIATFFLGSFLSFLFIGLFVHQRLSNVRPVESIASLMQELTAERQAFVGKSEEVIAKAEDLSRMTSNEREPTELAEVEERRIELQETINELKDMMEVTTGSPVPYVSSVGGNMFRLAHAYPAFSSDEKLWYKSKVRCEFQNVSGKSVKVQMSKWIPGVNGVAAKIFPPTLQIRIEGRWFPNGYPIGSPDGARELHVPPTEFFRTWIALEDETIPEGVIKRRLEASTLGTLELLVDGLPHEVQI